MSDRYNDFPDCTQEYIVKYNELVEKGLSRPIKIKAPLLGLEKEDVLKLLELLEVGDKDYFSGYGGIEKEKGVKLDSDWKWT